MDKKKLNDFGHITADMLKPNAISTPILSDRVGDIYSNYSYVCKIIEIPSNNTMILEVIKVCTDAGTKAVGDIFAIPLVDLYTYFHSVPAISENITQLLPDVGSTVWDVSRYNNAYLDMGYPSITPWKGTVPDTDRDEPACLCPTKALASYGHEKGCGYMAWKKGAKP